MPQGPGLGALLYLVYINGIAKHHLSLTRLFAGDSSLFNSVAYITDIACIINYALQQLTNWTRQWLVTFNQMKTKTEKARFPITTWFGNVSVNFVDSHKHPSITLTNINIW